MSPNRPLLLVVEDDPEVREVIVASLVEVDADILEREDGQQGFEAAMKYRPAAILTDINMPIMTGLDMLRELRAQDYECPVVILSAFGDRTNTVEALRLGAHDFITKPFNMKDLNNVVNTAVRLGVELKKFELEWNSYLEKNPTEASAQKDFLDRKKQILKMKFLRSNKAA